MRKTKKELEAEIATFVRQVQRQEQRHNMKLAAIRFLLDEQTEVLRVDSEGDLEEGVSADGMFREFTPTGFYTVTLSIRRAPKPKT